MSAAPAKRHYTPVESMAACLAAAYYEVTWAEGMKIVNGSLGVSHHMAPLLLYMAEMALDHLPYLEREKYAAMLDAEIGW